MLRFVVGRAGSGKTAHCLAAVTSALARSPEGPPLILLVPEQATFQVEQALLRGGVRGYARAAVLSFQRLAWRVLAETGGAGGPLLSEVGRRMLLRALLGELRPQLRLFRGVADRPGFIEHLSGTLVELADCCVEPSELTRRAALLDATGRGEGLLAGKLHDLALVQEGWQARLGGRLGAPQERLDRLCERLPESTWVRGAHIWVDGFAGFTPQELRVLACLLAVAAELRVALCLDPTEPEAADGAEAGSLFLPTRETRRQIASMAAAAGVVRGPDILLGDGAVEPRFRTPALAHVEREYGRFPGRRFAGPAEGIAVVAASDPRAEVEAAAREVLRLVRDGGCRFREVAVVVRDLDSYHDLIETAFRSQGIPCFVDRRRPVPHHPLVELVRSALEATAADWPYEAVFRYLKTDLVPVPREAVDALENCVLAFGLRGRHWYGDQPWTFRRRFTLEDVDAAEGGEGATGGDPAEGPGGRIERWRRLAAEGLRAFQAAVGGARRHPVPVAELSGALYDLLVGLGVPDRIARWSRQAEERGDVEQAQEDLQVWNGVVEVLDQTVECLGEVRLTLADYLHVVEAGLDGLRVGLVPAGLDQVLVGTVDRSRQPDLRAVLLLGVTDDAYPRRPPEDAVLSDPEREELAAAGLALGPTSRLRLQQEQYLAYIALTRASERLWVSYPLASEAGAAQAPAFLVRRLQALLPQLGPAAAAVGDGLESIASADDLALALARALRAAREGAGLSPDWIEVQRAATADPSLGRVFGPALAGLRYRNGVEPLPAEVARALYGDPLEASVTRLERFAACPFQHFAAFGLRLRPRAAQRLDPAGFGQLYHAALSLAARHTPDAVWEALDREAAEGLVAAVMDELEPALREELPLGSDRARYLLARARRTLEQAVLNLAEHARRGRFRASGVEVAFGPDPGAQLPALEYALPGGGRLVLRGRVDRIELAGAPGGRHLLRVIDFKSRPLDLRAESFYHGLSLQLGVYLLAAAGGLDAEPAGMLYLPVYDPVARLQEPPSARDAERQRRRLFRAGGWVLADAEAIRAMDEANRGDLVPARVTADGRPSRGAHTVSPAGLRAALRHVETKLRDLGGAILAGEAGVAPYRLAAETPCRHCEFHALCRFDPQVGGNGYRFLERLQPGDAWARMARDGEGLAGGSDPGAARGEGGTGSGD